MSETIVQISEFTDRSDTDVWEKESGFEIQTTKQTITLAIDSYQSCCESWGYFLTEDDPERFLGAHLLGVQITDTNRSGRAFYNGWRDDDNPDDVSLDEGDVMFVDIETDVGVLQFVAYNAHNGYYGHTARVSSKQLTHEVGL